MIRSGLRCRSIHGMFTMVVMLWLIGGARALPNSAPTVRDPSSITQNATILLFGNSVADAHAVDFIDRYKLAPLAVYMRVDGLSGIYKTYHAMSGQPLVRAARAQTIILFTKALK